jgi:DNA-binding transcriptional MocR family regulator
MIDRRDPAAKAWVAKKLSWRDRVADDSEIINMHFRIAYIISGYVNPATGDAWPPQHKIAERLGINTRTVQIAIAALVAKGYLLVQLGVGRGHTNRYRLALNGEPLFTLPEHPKQKDEQPFAKGRNPVREMANGHSYKNTSTIPLRNTFRADQMESLFEVWFNYYPHQVERQSALEAYGEIVGLGTATSEQLLDAVIRYAEKCEQDPLGQEPPTPAHWLLSGHYHPT